MLHHFLNSAFSFLFLLFISINSNAEIQSLSDDIELTGNFVQGGLVIGKTLPGSLVTLNGVKIKVSKSGDFVLGFHRDEPEHISFSIILAAGQTIKKQLNIQQRKYQVQKINGLPAEKISPKKALVLQRIRKESQQVAQARQRSDDRLDFKQTFIWPTIGPISGVYGSQRVLNGQAKRPHYGVDVAAPSGDDVLAPASGLISLAHSDMFYSGGTIILDHGHGLSSSFLHLSKILVKQGDMVKQGDLIAKVGATGRVTGAHLDWRMNLFKRRLDPQLLVQPMNNMIKK